MEEKKVTIEQAMSMSLDEYITESGIVAPTISQKYKNRGRRNKNRKMEDVDFDKDNDKEELTMDYEDCPNPKSQQWRLLPPNKPTRPAGMAPLVPLEADIIHQTLRSRSSIIREQQEALRQTRNLTIEVDVSDNNRNHKNNRNQFVNRNQYKKKRNLIGDGNRINPIKKNPNNFAVSVHQRLNINRYDPNAVSQIRNGLTVETALERKVTNVVQNVVERIANSTVAAVTNRLQLVQPAVNHLQLPPSTTPAMIGEHFLKTYMNVAPQVAGGLLNQNNATTELQKYDMNLQKEISEIQGKPLMYACPGSFVVSSDGKGLNCFSEPDSTGKSLNHRFA